MDDVEACDDGVNDGAYGGCNADCLSLAPYCGDAVVDDEEACDDGVNDGAYDGCLPDCLGLGEFCGDGVLNGPEECDDSNADSTDGCIGNCTVPKSCLEIINDNELAEDGGYLIQPEGSIQLEAFPVHCDMTTDEGGYTFLKINPGANHVALDAEDLCSEYGMQLMIPRTIDHKNSAWAISNDPMIGPDASPNYLRILGIYPNQNGATCNLQPMNSDNVNCDWSASDDGIWYIHEVSNINEPNGDNSTDGSMFYAWQQNGNIQHHNDIPGNGYSSDRYMCDVGDKQ